MDFHGRNHTAFYKKNDDYNTGAHYVENLSWKIWLPVAFFMLAVIAIIAMVAVILDSNVTKVSNQNLKDEIRKECGSRFFNEDGDVKKLLSKYCTPLTPYGDDKHSHSGDHDCQNEYNEYVNARFQHTYKLMDTCTDNNKEDWSHYMHSSCDTEYGSMRRHFDVRMSYMYQLVKHGCSDRKHQKSDGDDDKSWPSKDMWDVKDLKEYMADKMDWLGGKMDLIVVNTNNQNNNDNDIDIIIDNENQLDFDINGHIDSATETVVSSIESSMGGLGSSLTELINTLTAVETYLGMSDEARRAQTNLRQFIADGFQGIEMQCQAEPEPSSKSTKVENWALAGGDLDNSKYNPQMQQINKRNVHSVKQLWKHKVRGIVGSSATPTTDGSLLFSTDFAGDVFALSRETGKPVWRRNIKDILGVTDPDVVIVSRTGPAVYNDCLGQECIILGAPGDRGAGGFPQLGGFFYDGPVKMFALNRHTGDTIWISPDLDEHPWSQIGASPSIADGKVFGGIYSLEIVAPLIDNSYPCCSFRGSAFALDARSGDLLWQMYTIPEQTKPNTRSTKSSYAGVGIKGSSPSVDLDSRLVFLGTGQFSMFPDRISACLQNEAQNGKYPGTSNFNCLEDGLYPDSILALSIDTGAIVWSMRASGVDGWNPTCVVSASDPNCPKPIGPDYDFSQAPILYNAADGERRVFALQKSGFSYSLRASDGAFRWSRYMPTGLLGGGSWGCAHDRAQNGFVCQITGSPVSFLGTAQQFTYQLADGSRACDASWWFLDGSSGEVLWQTLSPYARDAKHCPAEIGNPFIRGMKLKGPDGKAPVPPSQTAVVAARCAQRDAQSPTSTENSDFARSYGAHAIGNGIVYVTEMTGNMYALDTKTGDCLALMHCDQGSIYGAPSLSHGHTELITVGCGYGRLRKEWVEHAGCEEGECSVSAFGL